MRRLLLMALLAAGCGAEPPEPPPGVEPGCPEGLPPTVTCHCGEPYVVALGCCTLIDAEAGTWTPFCRGPLP